MLELSLKSNVSRGQTLLVWDADGPPPLGDWTTVLWSGFGKTDDKGVISIPMLVEEQADTLRARYLAWVYELGEARINGKRLIDHLELRPGLSYWWMTSLAQKFNVSETSQINNAIKAFVLESLVLERKPIAILLVSNHEQIAATLQSLCQNLKLSFKWDFAKQPKKPKPIAKIIYNALPSSMRALIYFLWYVLRSLPLIFKKQQQSQVFNGEVTFIDVLVHLNRQAFTTGNFSSNYWTALVDNLLQSNVKTNWLHNYFCHKPIQTLVRAKELIGCFNKCSSDMQAHALIEENMSLSVLIKALKDYFRISRVSFSLPDFPCHFRTAGSSIDLWPLFKQEWFDSLRGLAAMINCLRIALYEKTFSDIPCQKLGIYIQENQSWELSLIYAWKAAGHGKIIGVPHTTVRYWDLRYFYDSRSYERTGKNVLPIPDLVAVNGPVAKKAYLEGGYPASQVKEVEALRFLYLLNRNRSDAAIKSSNKALSILVCGDFLSATNYKILSWIEKAAQSLPPETSYVFKPHPAYSVKPIDCPSLTLEISDAPLAELFLDCDVIFTSNITSAAVDAYCFGIPVVQMLDGNSFNISPLRGLMGVVYVTNPMELAEALLSARHRERVLAKPYFCLDKELPRWQKLLDVIPTDAVQVLV